MKRAIILIGVALALAGVVGLVHPRFTYHQKDRIAKVGPAEASLEEVKTAEVPVGMSILLIVAGTGLAVFGSRKKRPA